MTTKHKQDAEAPAAAANGSPRLPVELLALVVSHIDPGTDRSILVALLQTSQPMWDLVAPYLYRNLQLDDEQLFQLLVGSTEPRHRRKLESGRIASRISPRKGPLTERANRAFSFVRQLHLYPPPIDYRDLYRVSRSKIPLFPNVRTLRLEDDFDRSRRGQAVPTQYLPDDFVMFDYLDEVCIRGGDYSLDRLKYLACTWRNSQRPQPEYWRTFDFRIDNIRNLTIHCNTIEEICACKHLPIEWESFRIFVLETQYQVWRQQARLSSFGMHADLLQQPQIPVYLKNDDEAETWLREQWGTLEKRASLKITCGDSPPPCKVCGELGMPLAYVACFS